MKILKILLLTFIVVFSFARGMRQNNGGDFNVFWKAGQNLLSERPLYEPGPGEREFIYPPFAALFFTPLSIFSLNWGAFVFNLFNFFLWFLSFYLLYKIFNYYIPDPGVLKVGLALSFIFSFKLFWNNWMMVQTNSIILVFSLLGIYYFLRKRENWAIFYFALGTSIKIIPIFFFFWVIIRGTRWALLKSVFWGVLFILLPMMFGGFEKGFSELQYFYQYYVAPFLEDGTANLSYANQSLSSFIYKVFTSLHHKGHMAFTWWDLGLENAGLLKKWSAIAVFGLFLLGLGLSRRKFKEPNILEPALVFLTAHLLSGSTWKAHLVSLAFVYMALFSLYAQSKKGTFLYYYRWVLYIFIGLLTFTGKSIVGHVGQLYIGGWGFWTILMLALLFFFIFSLKEKKRVIQ